ncbi:MAG: PLP-dependent aminotransferase family protein, partial [Betaproteobacteria bacterium]|nr:PLP-dependent aminotransferase family protein [Betaproteobacteria bacterium]
MSLISLHPPMARRAALLRSALPGERIAECDHERDLICLAADLPDAHGFAAHEAAEKAAAEAAEATRRVLLRHAGQALRVGPCRGIAPLREWVAEHLAGQGLQVDPDAVLITTGTQQALDLLGKVLVDPSSPLLVQRPTSAAALRAFAPYAPRLIGVPCDEHGPDPQAFAELLPGARMAYLQTCFANPCGQTISPERAEQLVAALRQAPCWLVEDDCYQELWFDAPPPPGLLARGAPHGVRVGSFSRL